MPEKSTSQRSKPETSEQEPPIIGICHLCQSLFLVESVGFLLPVGTSQQLLRKFTSLCWLLTSEPVVEVADFPATTAVYNRFGTGQVEGPTASTRYCLPMVAADVSTHSCVPTGRSLWSMFKMKSRNFQNWLPCKGFVKKSLIMSSIGQ